MLHMVEDSEAPFMVWFRSHGVYMNFNRSNKIWISRLFTCGTYAHFPFMIQGSVASTFDRDEYESGAERGQTTWPDSTSTSPNKAVYNGK